MNTSPLPEGARPVVGASANSAAHALLQGRADEAAALLKALANPDRLLLLCHVFDAERTVAELGAITGIAQPTLSQQLGVLRHEGLVATRREGKFIHYRAASAAVGAILRTLCGLYGSDGAGPLH